MRTTININTSIYQSLKDKYDGSVLTKKQLANELVCSVSAINNYISKGYGIPQYKKMGNAKNARVVFPIINVASFLSETLSVA